MNIPGSYLLLIHVKNATTITAGSLQEIQFPRGWYAYCGSAKAGIKARVARHCRTENKKLRWHIDYLLDSKRARVVQSWAFPGEHPDECDLVQELTKSLGAKPSHKGFGASDCKSKCNAHLVAFDKKPDIGRLFPKAIKLKSKS